MIESIAIANVATFAGVPETLDGLARFNFLFGSNGTGKTTVGRVIADEGSFPACRVTWKGGTKLQPMVYNHDFIDRNFYQSSELKGVFTLGEEQKETLAKIAAAKDEITSLTDKISGLNVALAGADGNGGKKGELAGLEARLKDKCWEQKKLHDATLQGAFEGYRNSSEKFRDKVLQELAGSTASLVTLPELESRAATVFGSAPALEQLIADFDASQLLGHEASSLLKKVVIGKDDVSIAAMITKLGNSDWVRAGRAFYEVNDRSCPFCQQRTAEAFTQSLTEYFDEAFTTDSSAIDALVTDYGLDANRAVQQLDTLVSSSPHFLDIEMLKAQRELLAVKLALNSQRLADKRAMPSQAIALEPVGAIVTAIASLIDAANTRVSEHNAVVRNLATERATLTAQVWRFVVEELRSELSDYKDAKSDLEKAIAGMSSRITAATADKMRREAELCTLEKQTTSIQPTIDGINSLLSSFGFKSFKLAKSGSGMFYKLVRPDGADAKATLSEGEKTFVSFLYFYHLLKGSDSDSGMTTDRVVVFDDPVSSLDSDILFIVSSLIKGVFDEVRADAGHIKQVFVFTHNVYFHKEVTHSSRRRGSAMNEETFWIIRKPELASRVTKCPHNPIRTSYELLWMEVRKADRSNLGIQNALRRILESYFRILGGVDFDQLCAMFDGREKLIYRSLCSWLHDGSHGALDDLYIAIDDATIEAYLNVFRTIFEKLGHIAHYKMMMGDDFVNIPSVGGDLAGTPASTPALAV
jgi:wobble nucleotide-excising tRNase